MKMFRGAQLQPESRNWVFRNMNPYCASAKIQNFVAAFPESCLRLFSSSDPHILFAYMKFIVIYSSHIDMELLHAARGDLVSYYFKSLLYASYIRSCYLEFVKFTAVFSSIGKVWSMLTYAIDCSIPWCKDMYFEFNFIEKISV
jgi:hypothetical protein